MVKMKEVYQDILEDRMTDARYVVTQGRRSGKATMYSLEHLYVMNNMVDLLNKYVIVYKGNHKLLVKIDSYKAFNFIGTIHAKSPLVKEITFHYGQIIKVLPDGEAETLRLLYGDQDYE